MHSDSGIECGLCRDRLDRDELIRGGRLWICRRCVAQGLTTTLETTGSDPDGRTLPSAHRTCAGCGRPTPPSSLHASTQGEEPVGVCTSCLGAAYGLFTQQLELRQRRRSFAPEREPLAAHLLREHFGDHDPQTIVTSSRDFAAYLRADLQKTVDSLMVEQGARCVGLNVQYDYETTTYSSLIDARQRRVLIAPLQYEYVDVGEEEPVRCLRTCLWLVDGEIPHVLLLSRTRRHGEASGWHIEIAAPAGQASQQITEGYFTRIEESVRALAAYRGKVLSLECQQHYAGVRVEGIAVHRLAPVLREDIILPERTLHLLERNVFDFFKKRSGLRELGMPVKKGLLLYGPPGTGKTHTVRYLAGALPDHTTLLVTAEQVGAIADYMQVARLLSPAIVVIEDVDLIARDREELATPGQESLLNRLLNEMDGLRENAEILFVLTTNRPTSLEAALSSRPGRIDQAIEFPLPDATGRRRLIDLYRRGMVVPEESIEQTVRRTEGVSAAFIKELMRRTAQIAMERDPRQPEGTVADIAAAIEEMVFTGGSLNAKLLGAAAGPEDLA